jgi:outer membrane protein with beta-barrel domain
MRRTTLAVVLVLFVYAAPARAQRFGLIGGATLTHVDMTDSAKPASDIYHGKVIGVAGVVMVFPVASRVAVRTDLMFMGKGQTISAGALNGQPGSLDLNYFEIPVFGVVDLLGGRIRPYVLGGPSVGFLLGAYIYDPVLQGSTDFKYAFNSVALSMNAGGGVAFVTRVVRFFIETRYARGLNNIEPDVITFPGGTTGANTESMKTRGAQILIGVSMR